MSIPTRNGAAILMLGFLSAPAFGAPKLSERTSTYPVQALTTNELVAEMQARGPKGFWAYTTWQINWTENCAVTVHVEYILPQHETPRAMSFEVRKRFDAMLAALTRHEKQHGLHGIKAAREIDAANCRDAQSIVRKYNNADKDFDRRTNHGASAGVRLN